MKKMCMLSVLAVGLFFFAVPSLLTASDWLTDFEKAQKEAKEKKRLIFMCFTDPEACPACQMLEKNILSKSAFIKFASENLVLYKADLSRRDSAQLARLADKYDVSGIPLVVIADATGRPIVRMEGYMQVSVDEYVKNLMSIIKKYKK